MQLFPGVEVVHPLSSLLGIFVVLTTCVILAVLWLDRRVPEIPESMTVSIIWILTDLR